MLTIDELCLKIKESLKSYLSKEYSYLEINIIDSKIQDKKIKVFFLFNGDRTINVPVIPVETLYNMYAKQCAGDIEKFLKTLAQIYEKQYKKAIDISLKKQVTPLEKENINNIDKEKIFFVAINYHDNESYIANIPYFLVGDLAIIFRLLLNENENTFNSILITNEIMEANNYTLEDIKVAAYKNTEELFPEKLIKITDDCYMMTSEKYQFGASLLIYESSCIKELAERTGKNIIIVPFSINSVILLLTDENIREINLDDYKNQIISASKKFGEIPLNKEAILYSNLDKKLLFNKDLKGISKSARRIK